MAHSSILVFLDDDEIQDLTKKMSSSNVVTGMRLFSKDEVVCKLARLQCPFTWKYVDPSDSARNVVDDIEKKSLSIEDEGEEFIAWTKFVFNLILCYEYACMGLIDRALEKQQENHQIVEHALSNGVTAPVMGLGLKHVGDACAIFLLIKSKLYEKAIKNLHFITVVEEMDCREQASVWGVHGAFYMEYGLKGIRESVAVIKKALQLDSNCGEWHFLLGKALSRMRRIERSNDIPENEELETLESAVKMSNNSFYMVLLAHSYSDTARQICFKKFPSNINLFNLNARTDGKSLINEINRKAFELYKKAYENSKDNPYVLGRCAHGFRKLPVPWRNMDLAGDCIHRGLEKNSSNSFLIQTAAEFYKEKNEIDKAKYYFSRSAENGYFRACLELLDIQLKENKFYDPVPDMEKYIDRFKEKPAREYLLCLFGVFYYFMKHDFHSALKYWQQLMDSDMNSTYLQEFYSDKWIGAPRTCNISKIIIKEIFKRLESCSEEEKVIYGNILAKYKEHHPQLLEHKH